MSLDIVINQDYFPARTGEKLRTESLTMMVSDDSQLWLEFQGGSEKAFAKIYRLYTVLLFNYGMKIVKDKEMVKDCIQDLFMDIWNTKHRLGLVNNIRSYLFKSIRRKLITAAIKSRKKFNRSINFPDYEISSASKEFKLIQEQISDEKRDKLKEALGYLTHRQREIIQLKFFSRLDYSEISEKMGISMKGTYKLMGRSIRFLRKIMSNMELGEA